jgi:hypothetical protein
VATKRPADLKKNTSAPMTEEEIFDEIEEDLYLAPDGTATTYHEYDELDPGTVWYKNPPKEIVEFMSEEELAEIAELPDLPED